MMSNVNQYKCQSCTKTYTYKYNYERHVACCKFFQKSIHEYEHEMDSTELIPDAQNMFKLVQELAFRVARIEKENMQLKQQLSKRSKINILEWLNKLPSEKNPVITFTKWITDTVLQNVYLHLNNVYTNNLITGIVSTWKLSIDKYQGDVPVKAFESRTNTFYKYDSDANGNQCWVLLTTEELDNQLKKICKQFLIDFKKHWYDKHVDKIEINEKWTNMYVDYYQRILGGSRITTDAICQNVRLQLYKSMKQKFTQVELDFA